MTSVRVPPGAPHTDTRTGRAPSPPGPPGGRRWQDILEAFVRRHGWRAYALPILIAVTVVALVQGGAASEPPSSPGAAGTDSVTTAPPAAPTASPQSQVKVDQSGANVLSEVQDSAALPPGEAYTEQGAGTYSIIKGATAPVGAGPLRRYTIEYENGITGVDLDAMAASIVSTLGDPRSWTAGNAFSLQRVDAGDVDFRITLVSSLTVRTLCGYEEQIETSCWAPDRDRRVVLNDSRWVRGAMAYANDLATYHIYMVNHESGHALGFDHVFTCRADGKAPLMMQQTKTVVDENGTTCQPNPWPNP